jgi:hypothetical protein
MKIRFDFVTNSSSSSFIVSKKYLTRDQINQIKHLAIMSSGYDNWCIEETYNALSGFSSTDNIRLIESMEEMGIDMSKVHFGPQHGY